MLLQTTFSEFQSSGHYGSCHVGVMYLVVCDAVLVIIIIIIQPSTKNNTKCG